MEKSHSEKNKFDVDENSDLQLSFFSLNDDSYQNLKGELESIDMDNMTPIEALVKLSELKQKLIKMTHEFNFYFTFAIRHLRK